MSHTYTNALIKETSPYLLQHAHNPVNWLPWNDASLAQAVQDNKLIIVSVGYSSCHWCHVMEHESFENIEVAQVMNDHYISIKVDREERPDVDNVYMNAVQLMTGQGGWPLNVITLPDGRPVWGGTYFRKEEWINALSQINKLHHTEPEKLLEYAEKLSEGMQQMSIIPENKNAISFTDQKLQEAISKWSRQWDTRQGGLNRAPKFMMPSNYQFLLRYAHQTQDQEILDYVNATLEMIAYGGINDHISGGFARYSTDMKWHVPHFEKMLYDNAQLVSLYSDAYLKTKNELYKETVYQTLDFIKREMTTKEGGFYSALDADSLSQGGTLEEGAYYVWTKAELQELLGDDFPLFSDYYNVNSYGKWENDHYVLIKQDSDPAFAKEHGLTIQKLKELKEKWRLDLLRFRESKKQKPRLDDKILTSWNSLMAKGYLDAYRVFREPDFLQIAIKNALFIKTKMLRKDGGLNRTYKEGKSTINAYLEDYATTIEAYISLFEITSNIEWLDLSKELTLYTLQHFYNKNNYFFYFTSNEDASLASRNIEIYDNVISSSNSIMAMNLFKLSHYTSNTSYDEMVKKMLHSLQPNFTQNPTSFSNWMQLMIHFTHPFYEVIIVGKDAPQLMKELNTYYLPNTIKAMSIHKNDLALFKGRYDEKKTSIYVCKNNVCKIPVTSIKETLALINSL